MFTTTRSALVNDAFPSSINKALFVLRALSIARCVAASASTAVDVT
jgi:hypothetical protein